VGLFSRKKRDIAPADLPERVPAVQDQAVITHLRDGKVEEAWEIADVAALRLQVEQ